MKIQTILILLLTGLVLFPEAGCRRDKKAVEGVVNKFFIAAKQCDKPQLKQVLTPKFINALDKTLKVMSALVGNYVNLDPVTIICKVYKKGSWKILKTVVKDNKASVKVITPSKKKMEILLTKRGGKWVIIGVRSKRWLITEKGVKDL